MEKLIIDELTGYPINTENQHRDFSDQDLTGHDFSNQDLSFSIFTNSILRRCNFSNAILHYANFMKADITGADFTGAKTSFSAWLVRVPNGSEDDAATIRKDMRTRNGEIKKTLLDLSIVDDSTLPKINNEYEPDPYDYSHDYSHDYSYDVIN